MTYCCVPKCTSKFVQGSDISFHEIPSDENIRSKWLDAIARENWVPHDSSRVCSKHFLSSDYKQTAKRKCLFKTAIPSQFPDYPKYKQSPKKKIRSSVAVGKRKAFYPPSPETSSSIDSTINCHENSVMHEESNESMKKGAVEEISYCKQTCKYKCLIKAAFPSQFLDNPEYNQPPKKIISCLAIEKRKAFNLPSPETSSSIDSTINCYANSVVHEESIKKEVVEEINSVSDLCDKSVQVDVISKEKNMKLNNLKKMNNEKSERIQKLTDQLNETRKKLRTLESNTYVKAILNILEKAEKNDTEAIFFKNLVRNFDRESARYEDR